MLATSRRVAIACSGAIASDPSHRWAIISSAARNRSIWRSSNKVCIIHGGLIYAAFPCGYRNGSPANLLDHGGAPWPVAIGGNEGPSRQRVRAGGCSGQEKVL